jgi:toxin FitB
MRVIDTSLWVEFLADGALANAAQKIIEPHDQCLVPAMVHYELAKWCSKHIGEDQMTSVMSYLSECPTIEMDSKIAIAAAEYSVQFKLHATDAIIYASSQVHAAQLHTCDAHFEGLPGVSYIRK